MSRPAISWPGGVGHVQPLAQRRRAVPAGEYQLIDQQVAQGVQQDEARAQGAVFQAALPGRGPVACGDLACAGLDLGSLLPRGEAPRFELEVDALALYHVGGQPVLRRCQLLTAEQPLPLAQRECAVPGTGEPAQRSGLA